MDDIFTLGNEHHGCQLDNQNRILTYYDRMSLFEKLTHKPDRIQLKYDDIDTIKVRYGIVNGVRFGSVTITLEVVANQCQYDFPITDINTPREDLKKFICVLNRSPLNVIDKYSLLKKILESDQRVYDIVDQIDKQVQHQS